MARRMRFATWCKKDPEDERKINYRFTDCDGVVYEFTSEDEVTYNMIRRIRLAWIESIRMENNEWYAVIYED